MSVVYALELNNGKYYIGWTKCLEKRLELHRQGKSYVEWVKSHGFKRLIEYFPAGDLHYPESALTYEYVRKYGVMNVRGAGWCKMDYDEHKYRVFYENSHPGEYSPDPHDIPPPRGFYDN